MCPDPRRLGRRVRRASEIRTPVSIDQQCPRVGGDLGQRHDARRIPGTPSRIERSKQAEPLEPKALVIGGHVHIGHGHRSPSKCICPRRQCARRHPDRRAAGRATPCRMADIQPIRSWTLHRSVARRRRRCVRDDNGRMVTDRTVPQRERPSDARTVTSARSRHQPRIPADRRSRPRRSAQPQEGDPDER